MRVLGRWRVMGMGRRWILLSACVHGNLEIGHWDWALDIGNGVGGSSRFGMG